MEISENVSRMHASAPVKLPLSHFSPSCCLNYGNEHKNISVKFFQPRVLSLTLAKGKFPVRICEQPEGQPRAVSPWQ